MRYEQTEYDRITPPIRKRYKKLSEKAGEELIPLAAGESPPEEPEREETAHIPIEGWW